MLKCMINDSEIAVVANACFSVTLGVSGSKEMHGLKKHFGGFL